MLSFKEFKATVCTAKVAGPQKKEIKTTAAATTTKNTDSAKDHNLVLPTTSTTAAAIAAASSPSSISNTSSNTLSSSSAAATTTHLKMYKLFTFIDDIYRDIRRYNSGLYKDSYSTQLMQTINKYKNGCNEIFGKVLESPDMSLKLSQNIVRTLDIFKQLSTCLSDLEEYHYRVCEIMSIFIVCELRLSVDAANTPQEQLAIAHRIIYIMRRHLVQEEEDATLYNILRTLVYIPKLYNARDIMCAIFGEFIPIKPVSEVNVLPDKLYMLYIIVFYRWMMMQKDDDDKLLIVNFAESFMKPSVSLCSNNLYGSYLPMYTTHSTATRTILNNLKFYRDIRNASIIDNALKTIGSVVNLCDDDEDDDVIVVDATPPASDFAQIFATAQLEPLNGSMSNIKLEEKTVIGTVDLTMEEEETTNAQSSIIERHDKWLNDFQQLAKQYREAQLLLEKQQLNNQLISNREKEAVICLDSDSESEEEISSAVVSKETTTAAATASTPAASESSKPAKQHKPCEDLFVDSYPLTTTPIHCDTDLESLEADDEDDVTKISARFLSGNLRTYQAKKSNLTETEDKNNTNSDNQEPYQPRTDINKAYRRDSIHISSSPPEGQEENDEDEGTDVQDEHDDALLNEEVDEEDEANAYTFLPSPSKKSEKEIFAKQIRPMGPYPTYNNMQANDKVVFSQALTRYQQHQQDKHYYSDSSEAKTPKKQKKRVQFNTSPLGPTVPSSTHKMPLKPAIQQQKYKASDASEYFHLRDFDCSSYAGSVAGSSTSNSTSSSIKHQEQQEHLAAAATLFRNIFDRARAPYPYSSGPFSPSSMSLASHPPTPSSATRKKSRLPKNKKPPLRRPTMGTREDLQNMEAATESNNKGLFSIIRNREGLNDGYQSNGPLGGMPSSSYQESSDEFYSVVSDSDIVNNERYRNDAKLHKRCAVVITPTKELIQYERKRDQMYNEILLKQRRKLELRALEKQREKERRRVGRREEHTEQTKGTEKGDTSVAIQRDRDKKVRRKSRSYTEIFMSSESEFETNFQVRTRRQKQQTVKDLQQPLNIQIEMTEATTNSLLSQIDAHLEQPEKKTEKLQEERPKVTNEEPEAKDIKQKTCDINNDKGQTTKMRELNLLADIAQHLSPYQLDLPETNKTPTPPPANLTEPTATEVAKEKVTVTEHIILPTTFDNLLEKTQTQLDVNEQQQQTATTSTPSPPPSYAHEPKLNLAANYNSSPKAMTLPQQQNNTPLIENNEQTAPMPSDDSVNTKKIDETLEKILEESISVLKSVTSPANILNESPATPARAQTPPTSPAPQSLSETTIPILISNVKSLNHFEEQQEKDNSEDTTQHLLSKTTEIKDNVVLKKTKDRIQDATNSTLLSSTILNNSETSLLNAVAGDLSNISSEADMLPQALKVPSLMTADLSDISLESEISKHLPDIAEPSPVVTDMSDNSNESHVSKDFNLNNSSTTAAMAAVMSLPDLPLEMPNVATTNLPGDTHLDTMESNFQNLNTSLNTPTKLMGVTQQQQIPQSHNNDLNTPLKFPLQPDLENEATTTLPLKAVLEPEADNNVTKFLDLILNKTVTDAESETRDKIIKELNALTADSTATPSEASESASASNEEITATPPLESELTAEKSLELENTDLKDQTLDVAAIAEQEKEEQQQPAKTNTSLDSQQQTKEVNMENAKETPASANNEDLNPPKETPKEEIYPLENPLTKSSSSSPLKQTFNIKCRVRLKRLNIDEHCKRSKKETWMAMPLTKSEEVVDKSANINEMKNCDNTKMSLSTETTTPLVKKPCLKYNTNNKRANEVEEIKPQEQSTAAAEELPLAAKKAKLENEPANMPTTSLATATQQQLPLQSSALVVAPALSASNLSQVKTKTKQLKTVTFDLSNLNEELRDSTSSSSSTTYPTTKHKSKHHNAHTAGGAMGCYLKSNRSHKKLPDNTLRAAETLQIFVNTINDSTRTPPPAEFNKKRSPIKNKCIAEDETPRPPPASTLMGTPPCKKSCTDKARSQISSSKCKDQLVSSLAAPSISTITSDITTARIYTSSPLDQTLPEYDDNVDTVADTELILPTTTGSLRRKLKRPKKSLTRPEPADDTSTDDISNQPECNGEDDTDAVVDNEDDVFAEELLPIPAANEHILEEIVSARPTHMGTGTVIRDDYMNIEATATVPVYLFNDESRDLATPEPIQSSGDANTNVVDSSSYLNTSSSPANHNAMATATASTTSSSTTTTALGNLEKSMLSPSEHEVSSTQETFYQTPTKSKQNGENFGEKSSSSNAKDKVGGGGSSCSSMNGSQKLKPDEINFQNKQQEDHTSSTTGLLQNNQVDTTNHSPEMCTLTLTPTTTSTTTSSLTNNRKMRKVSTHDEILFNELQQQQQQQQQQLQAAANKRKNLSSTTTFCAESTSDHNNSKTKVINNNTLEETSVKSNGSLAKEDKFKKLLKEACKRDKNLSSNELEVVGAAGGLIAGTNIVVAGAGGGGGGGGGGSSPSTTTLINEDKISRSKRKKQKSSKSSKSKNHNERCTKIVLKASKLSAHVPATPNPLIITIPKSRILRPPPTPTPPTPTEVNEQMEEFLDIPNAKLFTEKQKEKEKEKDNGTTLASQQQPLQQHHLSPSKQAQSSNSITKKEWHQSSVAAPTKSKRSHSPVNNLKESSNLKTSMANVNEIKEAKGNSTSNNKDIKEKTSTVSAVKSGKETETKEKSAGSATIVKKKTKTSSSSHSSSSSTTTNTNNHNNNSNNKELVFVKDKYDLIKNKEKSHQNNDIQEHKEKVKEKTNSQATKPIANTTSSSQNRLHKSSTKDKIKEKSHKNSEKSNNLKFNISLPISHKHTNSSSTTHSSTSSNKTSNSKNTKSSSSHNSSSSSSSSSNLTTATNAIHKTKTNLSTTTANATDNNNLGTPTSTSTLAGSSSSSSSSTVTISTHHVRKKLKTK